MSDGATEQDTTTSVPSGGGPEKGPQDTAAGAGGAPDPHGVKLAGDDSSAAKDAGDWVTGEEPMTGPQASYLETLAHQAGEEVPTGLTKAQASERIERLQGEGSDPAGDPSRVERPTDEWVTGDEPMTGPQASYLETLAQQAGVEVPTGLNKSQASRAIDDLRSRAGG